MKHQIQGLCRRQVNDREIHVRDAIAAKEWYGEILGVRTHRYAAGWKSFVLGDIDREHEFTLIQAAQRAGTDRLVWRFETLDALWLFYRRVRDMGVAFKEMVDSSDSLAIHLRDPDGNRIEIRCDVAGAAAVRGEETWHSPVQPQSMLPWSVRTVRCSDAAFRQYAVAA